MSVTESCHAISISLFSFYLALIHPSNLQDHFHHHLLTEEKLETQRGYVNGLQSLPEYRHQLGYSQPGSEAFLFYILYSILEGDREDLLGLHSGVMITVSCTTLGSVILILSKGTFLPSLIIIYIYAWEYSWLLCFLKGWFFWEQHSYPKFLSIILDVTFHEFTIMSKWPSGNLPCYLLTTWPD